MRRRRNKRFKKIKLKIDPPLIWTGFFLAVSLLLLGSLGYLVFNSATFRVQSEEIKANVVLSQKIKDKASGKSLFSLDLKQIAAEISKDNPEYKSVEILKRFPRGFEVKVEQRIPCLQIKAKKFYPVDPEGVIISDGSLTEINGLIVAEIPSDSRVYRKGYQLKNEEFAYLFDLVSSLKKVDLSKILEVSSINAVVPEGLYFMANFKKPFGQIRGPDKKLRVIIGSHDFIRKLTLFKDVVNVKFKDKLDLIQYIDLRYKEVYVGFDR
ncbi:MAG: FtsQ-type POTRA domain-containing protein [Candidatus Omnitrophica bacterium]|nr:FtsQ-type POTRA domain-containing protein [Candidatus Omnitrophota bacterium]MBU2044844.1 FtsQ-type POTRA domain-containing protein [Candidatus Omnitrophota bacterium]MBU2251161.1 FtsQ-type POTRA domain-containing protein [Candidatus Omnitrophota bacterium]MBU2473641.1 FtsQ-type POTRA domain-containing protein [Candidatus Omnitrophota bacterium]